MTTKLTELAIRAAQPNGKLWYLRDSIIPGFAVRITPVGTKSFIFRYPKGPRKYRHLTIGKCSAMTVAKAREVAGGLYHKTSLGADPVGDKKAEREALTLGQFCREYLASDAFQKLRPRSKVEYRRHIEKVIVPALGNVRLAAVTRADVRQMHRHETGKRGPISANRSVTTMSALLGEAVDLEMLPFNPLAGRKKWMNKENQRERKLSVEEIARLSAVLDAWPNKVVANCVKLLLLTGARKSEAVNATWDQFDLDAGLWVKPATLTKQNKVHHLPLATAALDLLKSIQPAPGYREPTPVFSGQVDPSRPLGALSHSWERIRQAAGLDDVRLHDIRHTVASLAASGGVGLTVVGGLLGHSQPSTTSRYTHLYSDPLRAAAEIVAAKIMPSLVEPEPDPDEPNVVPLRRA